MFKFTTNYLNMNQFSISQLAQFSGIKAHTIRIWEQRYKALNPKRSEGNTRYYDGEQLRRLLNIVSLSGTGKKISSLCGMKDEELYRLVEEYTAEAVQQTDFQYFVNQLISAGMTYDEINFHKIFSHCQVRFGLQDTYKKVIYPLLDRIGLMWLSNSIPPSQEHYISNLLCQKIFTAIDALALPKEDKEHESWVLFLPENEFHEIGLLYSNYVLRSKGQKVIYLGPNVPLASVKGTLADTGAANLLLFLVHKDAPENLEQYLVELQELQEGTQIWIAGNSSFKEEAVKNVSINWLFSTDDLEERLGRLTVNI